jgi:hypothetical protein
LDIRLPLQDYREAGADEVLIVGDNDRDHATGSGRRVPRFRRAAAGVSCGNCSHGGWSTAQIVGEHGHGTPTSFSGAAVDNDQNDAVIFSFSEVKGGGNANQNQDQTTCTETFTGTATDVFGAGVPLPSGVNADDSAFTMAVTVVLQ